MAVIRETPKCFHCGKPIAKAIYLDQSDIPDMQKIIGDTFLRWESIEHDCISAENHSLKEVSVLWNELGEWLKQYNSNHEYKTD